MKRIMILFIITLSISVAGVNDAKADPNAIFTHIYFLQYNGTTIDLINGGVARVYASQPADVNLTFYNAGSSAHFYNKLNDALGSDLIVYKDEEGWSTWTWSHGISSMEGTYTCHAELWWWDGADNGTSVLQDSKDFTIVVIRPGYDLMIKLIDQIGRPIAGAWVSVKGAGIRASDRDGLVYFNDVFAGTHDVIAIWRSRYNPEKVAIANSTITLDEPTNITLKASVYDADLKLITPSGKPIVGAQISLGGVYLGWTDADGKVVAPQVPSKYANASTAYPVTSTWSGVDVSPGPVNITASNTYILTATNVATLTVRVVGARGQYLPLAHVIVCLPYNSTHGLYLFNDTANEQGVASVDVPYGTYDVYVNYKGFTNAASSTVSTTSGTVQTIATDVFLEFEPFGPMTFANFLSRIVFIVITIAVIVVIMIKCIR